MDFNRKNTISKGFVLAGLMNIGGVLGFSKFFTGNVIQEVDPIVMSNFGLIMIIVWGLAYISVSNNFEKVKWLIGVFAIEKLIYASIWLCWILSHNLSAVFEKDIFAGCFYSIYGINDWIFFFFFTWVFILLNKREKSI